MAQGKTFIILLVTLVVGFGAGFVLRPVIAPVEQAQVVASSAPATAGPGNISPPISTRRGRS